MGIAMDCQKLQHNLHIVPRYPGILGEKLVAGWLAGWKSKLLVDYAKQLLAIAIRRLQEAA
jgi:hypothetical protein